MILSFVGYDFLLILSELNYVIWLQERMIGGWMIGYCKIWNNSVFSLGCIKCLCQKSKLKSIKIFGEVFKQGFDFYC